MERYATKIENGTVYIEDGDGWLTVGAIGDIFEIVGGEEYAIDYEETTAAYYDWLDTDEGGTLRFDVRETIEGMTYPADFVAELEEKPLDGAEYPERTVYFAELMVDIWDSKGNLDDREDNPFD